MLPLITVISTENKKLQRNTNNQQQAKKKNRIKSPKKQKKKRRKKKKMLPTGIQLPETRTMISTAASVAASVMLLRSLSRDFVPQELRRFSSGKLRAFLASFSNDLTLVIEEFDGLNRNHLFTAADAYLGHSKALSSSSTTFRLTMHPKERAVSVSIHGNESIVDTFDGVTLTWRLIRRQIPATYAPNPSDRFNNPKVHAEIRYFELRFHKKHKKAVLDRYLKHVVEESKSIGVEKKSLKLFTLKDDRIRPRKLANTWQGVDLDHPATFDTVAMEAKKAVMEDLERFVRRKDLYRKVGKAWKRGYLLFGPPGTGKSSLIAAMANFLKFDVYDLGLADLGSNSELRRLLIATANRSILVVEDIDCSIELQNRARKVEVVRTHHHHHLSVRSQGRSQVTLSGLLNFIDGLWSSCGDERIIVFTTNHKDRLDPALLRPGRMDVHIHMSYCSPCGFRMLASNYLGIEEHPLFSDVEELVGMTRVTPAEVGEELMKNEEPEIALRGLIRFLEHKIASNETEEARNVEGDEVSKESQQHGGGH